MEKYMEFNQRQTHTHIGRTELLLNDLIEKYNSQPNKSTLEIPKEEIQETIEQLKKFKDLMNVSFIYLDSFEKRNYARLVKTLKAVEELYRTEIE